MFVRNEFSFLSKVMTTLYKGVRINANFRVKRTR